MVAEGSQRQQRIEGDRMGLTEEETEGARRWPMGREGGRGASMGAQIGDKAAVGGAWGALDNGTEELLLVNMRCTKADIPEHNTFGQP